MLEFALVLPVLLAMIFGLLELGNIYFANATVQKAAQAAARYAVTGSGHDDGTRIAGIEAEAREVADVLPGEVTVTVTSWDSYADAGGGAAGNAGDAGTPCELIQVEVDYPYKGITPIVGEMVPDDFVLKGRERMVNEPWMPCN